MNQTEKDPLYIKIRMLKVRDLKTLTELFEKHVKETSDESLKHLISSAIPQGTKAKQDGDQTVEEHVGETVIKIGTAVLTKMTSIFNEDVTAFFADLLGVTVDEYYEMEIDTPIKIIQQIRTAPEVGGFFTMHSLASKAMVMFEKPLEIIKTRFDSIFEEAKKDS